MTATIDIYDPDGYADGPPHELFAELRRTQPVYWQEMPDEPGYWAVLKHADVVHVAKEPTLFSANEAGVVLENLTPEALEGMRMMLLAMDPPKHVTYRRPLAPSFKARVMAQIEGRIREICREIMQEAAERRDVEFVHDVTASLPTQVIGELMGLPRAGLGRDPHDGGAQHPQPGSRDHGDCGCCRGERRGRRHGDVRDPVREPTAAARNRVKT